MGSASAMAGVKHRYQLVSKLALTRYLSLASYTQILFLPPLVPLMYFTISAGSYLLGWFAPPLVWI
jgi:hypothetical protein